MDAIRVAFDLSQAGDVRTALPPVRRAGFDGISLAADRLRPRELSQSGRREVRSLLSRYELAGAFLRVTLPGKGLTPDADVEHFLDDLRTGAELARDCAFAGVACDLGRIPRAEDIPPPKKPVTPEMAGLILLPETVQTPEDAPRPLSSAEKSHAAMAAEVLREAGNRLDRIGTPVAFSATLAGTHDLVALLRSAGCPLFFRELDPASSVEEGPASLVAIKPAVLHVRGTDAQAVSGKTRPAAPGQGDANWPELLEALRDADYTGFITVEGPLNEATGVLRRLRCL